MLRMRGGVRAGVDGGVLLIMASPIARAQAHGDGFCDQRRGTAACGWLLGAALIAGSGWGAEGLLFALAGINLVATDPNAFTRCGLFAMR